MDFCADKQWEYLWFVREYLVKQRIEFWHFKANKVKLKLSWHKVEAKLTFCQQNYSCPFRGNWSTKNVPLHLEDSLMISQGQPFRTHFPRSAHAQRCNQGVKVDQTKTSFFRQELGSVPYLNSKETITDLPTNWPINEWFIGTLHFQ